MPCFFFQLVSEIVQNMLSNMQINRTMRIEIEENDRERSNYSLYN